MDESKIHPRPVYERDYDRRPLKLEGKAALVTGADSGIGRAVAVHFARRGPGAIWTPLVVSPATRTALAVSHTWTPKARP